MIVEQGLMSTEVIFNDDKTERYLLRKVWNEDKPLVSLIMTNPSSANAITIDMTVHYSICNLYKLGYGAVDILNMTSTISTKIDTKSMISISDTNVEQILKSAEKSDKVIIAWGKIGENNKKIRLIQLKLLDKLQPFQEKLYWISSETGNSGFHPLAPQIRFDWYLERFVMPEYLKEKQDDKPENPPKDESAESLKDESEVSTRGRPSKRTSQPVVKLAT